MNTKNNYQRTFSYDNYADYDYLKKLFYKANKDFINYDFELIEDNVAEQDLCAALKTHLHKYLQKDNINDYKIDIEYNRNNGNIKSIIDEDLEIVNIKCDLILHSRGHNKLQDNLLALEMKKSYRSKKSKFSDRKRLIALTKCTYDNDIWSYDGKTLPEHVCRYIIGIYYELDWAHKKILLEFFKEGKLTETDIIDLSTYSNNHYIHFQ